MKQNFTLPLLVMAFPILVGAQNLCVDLIQGRKTFDSKVKAIESVLIEGEVGEREETQSVFYRGKTQNEQSILLKPSQKTSWFSKHNPFLEGYSIHGDIRSPIAAFGAPLALKMGFEVETNADGSTRILVPQASRIAKFVKRVNKNLIAKGKEPITYLPVGSGFVTDQSIIEMAAKENSDEFVFFPFADSDPELTPHEISYHLTPLLYPKSFNQRMKRISKRYLQMIELIKSAPGDLKDSRAKIIALLRHTRSIEVDFGYANTGILLAQTRILGKTYSDFVDELKNGHDFEFQRYLEYAIRLDYPPALAVAAQLTSIFMLVDLNAELFGHSEHSFREVDSFLSPSMTLRESEKAALKKVIRAFLKKYLEEDKAEFKTMYAGDYAKEMVSGLDQRIKDIEEAAGQ